MEKRVLAALDQALVHARRSGGGGGPSWSSPTPDEIRALREELGLSQREFADRFGFDLTTVRNWEQSRSKPERAKGMYLKIIQADPEAVAALVEKVERQEILKRARDFESV
jgi:putative transcriptional regulator